LPQPLAALAPRVTDFGLARRGESGSGMTATGAVLGTPSYMPPEQARGMHQVTPAADVYSLGAILYECLTGRPPFLAATAVETMQRVLTDEPLAPRSLDPSLPRDLETVCLKCLHKDPARRYSSAGELADDLRRWQSDEPIAARPIGVVERAVKWSRRHPTAAAVMSGSSLAAVLLLALGLFATAQWRQAVLAREQLEQEQSNLEEERRARALDQVRELLSASPGAVPAILARLEESPDVVLERLRHAYRTDPEPNHRMRLALALLPHDPDDVLDGLLEWMLTAEDPAEVLLIRDALKPHADLMRKPLWEQASADDPAAQMRALAALAAYDPRSPRWREVGPAAADRLLASNPLHIGIWATALEPVRDALLPRLSAAFAGKAEQRQIAAVVLAGYVRDRPDALAELLLAADAKQAPLLRPLADPLRRELIPHFQRELSAAPEYWKDAPLAASWKAPEDGVREELSCAGGLIADRFALCQALPLDRLLPVAEALRPGGYRPITVRPRGDGRTASVVWTRDGGDCRLEVGLTLEGLKAADERRNREGLLIDDVAAYRTPQGRRFVGLWRRGEKGEKAAFFADLIGPQTGDEYARLGERGLTPRRRHALLDGDRTRYSGVWVTPSPAGSVNLGPQDSRPQFAARVRAEERLAIEVNVSPAPTHFDALVWSKISLEVELSRAVPLAAASVAACSPWSMLPLLAKLNDPERVYRIGYALYKGRRDAEALRALDAYVLDAAEREAKPNASAYRYQAIIHARKGREADARVAAKMYFDARPAPHLAFSADALVDLYLGQEVAASKAADEAAGKGPQFAYEAACVYSRAAQRLRQKQAAAAAALVAAPSWAGLASAPGGEPARLARRGLELLRQAVAGGYANWSGLLGDVDLDEVRALPAYRAWVAEQGVARYYDSVSSPATDRQAVTLFDLSPEDHLARCRELAAEGYRPVALSLAELPLEDRTVVSSVWHRPVLPAGAAGRVVARKGTAAVLLLALGEARQVWPLWKQRPDPAVRNHLVARSALLRVEPRVLIDRLESEKDASARRALILSLGEYTEKDLPAATRDPLVKKLLGWYRDDPDPGVHSAIDWLLRHGREGPTLRPLDWGQSEALDAIDKELAGKKPRFAPQLPLPAGEKERAPLPSGGRGRRARRPPPAGASTARARR
jgi:hypothetical protein